MRIVRLLTLLVTLLSLPAYGWAAVAHARSCQEQLTSMGDATMADDCCPHPAGKKAPCELPGKSDACSTCNAGHNCKSPQTYQPTQLFVTLVIPVRQAAAQSPPAARLSSPAPDGLWRPPTLI